MVVRAARGFTLIELVTVMVIVGVLAAIGAVRFFDRVPFDASAFAEQTRAALRFGQKLAIAQHRPVYVQFNANTIALCFSGQMPCPAASRVPAPAGNGGAATCSPATWYCEAAPATLTYSLVPATSTVLCFNALGQPGLGAACAGGFTGLSVVFLNNGITPGSVNVSAETGYVD